MLNVTAAQQAVLNAGVQAEFCRVSIKDSGGTYRDLTVYPGFNAVKSVQWSEQIDDPQAKFTVVLFREQHGLSLSPYMGGSALNRGFNPAASPAALIAVNRELKIECAIVPMDTTPASGDWFEVFRGRVETVDAASGYTVELTGQGLASRLAQQFIKYERVYSYAANGGTSRALRVWEPNQVYALGEYALPASRGDGGAGTPDPGFNKFVKNSQAGTSGTTEPIWTTGAGQVDGTAKWDYIGAPTTSGNPVEQVMQNILADNKGVGDPTVTLFTPVSPSWQITQFIQQREFTMDAVVALAQQIGWDLRYKWRTATAQFELTFIQPQRTSPAVLFTFGPSDYGPPSSLKVDITTIRNSIRVWYGDASDLWPDGTPKRKPVEVSDSASITKYGELWMEIQEDQTSQIDSNTEASALANAALSDLKEPTAQAGVELMRGFPWVELNDYYTFTANNLHFDSNLSLAVTQYQHTFEGGRLKTSLQLRGLPTIGAKTYLRKRVQPKSVPGKHYPHQVVHFNGPKTPSVTLSSAVGGQRIQLAQSFDKRQLAEEYEVHVYPVSGTTLGSGTLKAIAKDRALEVTDLIPGKAQYVRVVPRYRNADRLIVGQPSAEQSFTAGQAAAGHLQDGIGLGDYPLNGGFETRFDTTGMPDHWSLGTGAVLGSTVVVMEDGNGISGTRYMKLAPTGSQVFVNSALLPIINEGNETLRNSGLYRFSCWCKNDPGNVAGTAQFFLEYFDYTGTSLGLSAASANFTATTHVGHWVRIETYFSVGGDSLGITTPRSIRVQLATTAQTFITYVDEVRVQYIGTPWYAVGDTTRFTDNYEAIPGFAGAWVNFNAGDFGAAFRRTQLGDVQLRGIVKSGVVPSTIFNLPVGFRPPKTMRFACVSNALFAEVDVTPTGPVQVITGSNVWVDLSGISFGVFN